MLFLVSGEVTVWSYENGCEENKEIRLVEAIDSDKAELKFEKHFTSKSIEYYETYSVRYIEVTEVIV